MNAILYLTYPLSGLVCIALGVGLGAAITRRFGLGWRLYWIGAAAFVGAQVLHIPFNLALGALFQGGFLPGPPESWRHAFNALVLGLSAGLFEELARYAAYRWWARDARSWARGLLLGAGHGGIEALLIGLLVLITYVVMLSLRGAEDLARLIPEEQLALARQQIDAFWSATWYDSLLAAYERAATLPVQVAMSILVLQAFTRRQIRWLFAAIGWHTLLDAVAVYIARVQGVYLSEAFVGLFGVLSLGLILALRSPEPPQPEERPTPAFPEADLISRAQSSGEDSGDLEKTRYTRE